MEHRVTKHNLPDVAIYTVYAAYLDGKDEGESKGRNEERARIVRNALKKNMPVEDIAELAGLTVAEVRNLIN